MLWALSFLIIPVLGVVYYPPRFIIKHLQKKYKNKVHFMKENPQQKEIAFTIDDVPYGYEDQIIKLLDEHNIKVTFFLIAKNLTQNQKELFAKAVQNGHQIANHGITNSMHALKNQNKFINEVQTCEKSINEIYQMTNVKIPQQKYYRPGCGHFTKRMIQDLTNMGYQIVLGSVYPHDPQQIIPCINYKFITSKLQKGDIVIIHDRKFTPSLLKKLLPWLNQHQYICKTLDKFNLGN